MITLFRLILLFYTLLLSFITPVQANDFAEEKLVSLDNTRLYISCMGLGNPVIVLDAGMGRSSQVWEKVQAELAGTSKTCIYDRAGYGRSDPGEPPRKSSRVASELQTLLTRANIPPPYLLVGHSFGGLNMRLFSDLFSKDVAGLVLVDSPYEDQVEDVFQSVVMQQIDPAGTLRHLWRPEVLSSLSNELEPLAALFGLDTKTFRAIADEAIAFQDSADEVRHTRLEPELPLTVIMHGQRVLPPGLSGDQLEQQWLQSQQELVNGQKHGRMIIAEKSAHNIMFQQPELIISAIQDMVEKKRH